LKKLGISDFYYDSYQATPEETKSLVWYPKKIAEIRIGREEVGFLGEISSSVLEGLGIKEKVSAFVIDFEKLSKYVSEEVSLGRFPNFLLP